MKRENIFFDKKNQNSQNGKYLKKYKKYQLISQSSCDKIDIILEGCKKTTLSVDERGNNTHINISGPSRLVFYNQSIQGIYGDGKMPNDTIKPNAPEQLIENISELNNRKHQDGGLSPVNVKDAANYLVRLFYNGKKSCGSAIIQKLLFIAQLKSLYDLKTPLFNDNLTVKLSCFSIDFISLTYPTAMFCDENNKNEEISKVPQVLTPTLSIIEPDMDAQPLAAFYDMIEDIPFFYKNILSKTYKYFGMYSGAAIAELTRQLSLHSNRNPGEKVSVDDLKQYVHNIPDTENNNPIIWFIKNV